MVRALVEDRQRWNLECASDFFFRVLDPITLVEYRGRSGNIIELSPELGSKSWYKQFLSRHPGLSAICIGSQSLDDSCALNNNPRIVLWVSPDTEGRHRRVQDQVQEYIMDGEEFLIGLIQCLARTVVNLSDMPVFLWQSGQWKTITVIDRIGPGLENRGL